MHDALKLWSQAACVIRSRNCKYFARDDETYATASALNGGKTPRGQGAAGLSWRGEDERERAVQCVLWNLRYMMQEDPKCA